MTFKAAMVGGDGNVNNGGSRSVAIARASVFHRYDDGILNGSRCSGAEGFVLNERSTL